jgi:hypothetical protein
MEKNYLHLLSFNKIVSMKSILIICMTILMCNVIVNAQNCGTEMFNQYNKEKYGAFREKEANLLLYKQKVIGGRSSNINPLVIPVVIHVVHQNGPENVPDSVLYKIIDGMNERFSNSGQFYEPTGRDINIQFCLASIDPYGNPTTGITRDTSRYTDSVWPGEDSLIKNVNRWNPYRYLNIWIVHFGGPLGRSYSSLPWDIGTATDGILMPYSQLGLDIPTHEVGHYLGLYHHQLSFYPYYIDTTCINNNCMLDGDCVCDTPPESYYSNSCSTSSCSSDMDDTSGFNPFISDTTDISTFMTAKANCPLIFTQGQSDRMNSMLMLYRYDLLSSNGCGQNPGGSVPSASFTWSEGCVEKTFISTSIGAEYVEWDFNNDGYIEAIGDTVRYHFPTSGIYTIVMRAFANGGFDTDTLTVFIQSRPNANYPIIQTSGIDPFGNACIGSSAQFIAAYDMVSYQWSTGDTTQVIHFTIGSSLSLGLTCIDTMGLIWKLCPDTIKNFNMVAGPPKPVVTSLFADSVCFGDTLDLIAHTGSNSSVFNWTINNIVYASNNNIYNLSTNNNVQNYQVSIIAIDSSNFCQTKSDTTNYYVEPQFPLPYIPMVVSDYIYGIAGNWNNQFYLDGNPISGATGSSYQMTQTGCYTVSSWQGLKSCEVMSDSVCWNTTSIPNLLQKNEFYISPNPTSGIFLLKSFRRLTFKPDTWKIFDSLGHEIPSFATYVDDQSFKIDIGNAKSGIYFLKINNQYLKLLKN